MLPTEFGREKAHRPGGDLKHRGADKKQDAGADVMNKGRGNDRAEHAAERTADSDETKKPFALFIREQIGHESPKDSGGEQIEHAHPNKETNLDPPLRPRWRKTHEDKENDQI